jgi:phosphoenolpyruvate synthase/pyruvate phosphate dikinase
MTILQLSNSEAQNNSQTGGKGSSLAKMISAGLSVPNGFVLTAEAYSLYSKLDIDTLPSDFKAQTIKAFENINAEYVAVRSSANCEDGADNSFAGQFDSFLNTTKDNLIENILKCWDSINSPRCLEYLKEKGIIKENVKVAVVVQKMIQSEVSGITFTINPVTNDTSEIMIEAGYGLGEAIVSGQVTPDNYLVNKQDLTLNEVNISEQSKKLILENKQNTWLDISANTSKQQKLSNDQIKELAKICLQIENYYNHPCDIEWAFAVERFYITQSRPVTTIVTAEKENNIVNNVIRYSHKNKLSKQGGNISPLTYVSAYEFFNDLSFKKYYDFDFGSVVGYNKGKEGIFFFSADNYKKTLEMTYSKLNKTIFELLEYKDWQSTKKTILDYYNKINLKQIKSLSDD